MIKSTESFRWSEKFYKINLQNSLIALGIGWLISIIQSLSFGHLITPKNIFFNLIFSLSITLSITNSIFAYQRFVRPRQTTIWKSVVVYYSFNVIGMFIGIELSYLLLWLFFDIPYKFIRHISDYQLSFIVVLVVGTILYVYHAQKANLNAQIQEKELDLVKTRQLKTQAELQTLQSKINPHFLYNALNSIASLIHEDPDKAEDMTLKLSRLFRYSINTQQENMALVKDEMEIVNTYLDIEKVRFGDRINFTSVIADGLEQVRIPRFLIQPLVENALKHGLKNTATNGELWISVDKTADRVTIKVADNGINFPDELNMGYGLQSTYEKLHLLYGNNYEMQLMNTPQKQVVISLPLTNA